MKIRNRFTFFTIMMFLLVCWIGASTTAAGGISATKIQIQKGKTYRLTVSGAKKVTWKSSKKSVATVTSQGVVKGIAAGKATITAKTEKRSYRCTVTVVTYTTALDNNTYGMSEKEAQVYRKLLSLRRQFYEGRRWTNQMYYEWNGGIFSGGYGCTSFAFILSDAVFRNAPATQHTDFDDLHVGDIVRYENNGHSVVVLKKTPSSIVVAEGNYHGTIHWGRVIPLSEIRRTGTYVMTRY